MTSPLHNKKPQTKIMFEAYKQADVKSEAMYPKKTKPENRNHFRGYVNQTRESLVTFFYPDYYCRLWNFTKSCASARGLYHRSGVAPCPEGYYLFFCIITHFVNVPSHTHPQIHHHDMRNDAAYLQRQNQTFYKDVSRIRYLYRLQVQCV